MNGKRILMVQMGMDIGGAETHVLGLSLTLQRMGYEVMVASSGGVYVANLEEAGIRHFHVPANNRNLKNLWESLRCLRKIILEEKPDLVHAHARIPAFLCGILQRQLHFPFVTTAHWVFRVNPTLRFLTDWGQQTIAVSEDIRDYLVDRYNLPAGQIVTTVNGIDTDGFSPGISGDAVRREFSIPEDAPCIVCVTRLHQSRARSALLLAEKAVELAKALPGLRILLVGDGDARVKIQGYAKAAAAELGYECVILTGGRTDIPQLVAAGDIFVGVSRAALEAMSCGKPTILCGNEGFGGLATAENHAKNLASNYCCRDCVESTGDLLVKSVLELYAMTPEALTQIGQESRELILRHFSLEKMAGDCLTAYDRVLNPRKKLVVSGYYGHNNQGDEAILRAISCLYGQEYELTVLSRQPRVSGKRYGVTAIHRYNFPKIYHQLRRSDLLVSGGGSLLQDRTSTRSLLYYLSVIRMAELAHTPIMVYANGIGPITGKHNRKLTANTMEKVDAITLRDPDSLRELRSIGVKSPMTVTADPVFALTPGTDDQARAYLAAGGVPAGKRLLGVSVRTVSPAEVEKLARFLDLCCERVGLTPVFVVMQASRDMAAAEAIRKRMTCQAYLLDAFCSAEVMMAVVRQMELVISMRLHAMIFAATVNTPIIGFDYDPKIDSLLSGLGMPSFGPMAEFSPERAVELVSETLSCREGICEKLAEATAHMRQQVERNSEILSEVLHTGAQPRQLLHIIGGGDSGGAKTHVLSLLRGLMDDGIKVSLVCFLEGDFSKSARDMGIPTIVMPRNKVSANLQELRRLIREKHPDVIHCHGAKANMYANMLRRKVRVPIVTTVHSNPWLDYMGRPVAKLLYGNINLRSLKNIPYYICVSEALQKLLISKGFAPKNAYIIHNGVDFSTEVPAMTREQFLQKIGLNYEEDSVIFGIAARLSPVKDIPTLLWAFSRVVGARPSARLIIAGDGEEADKLKQLASEICPAGTVCFAGWLNDTDSFYHAIDVNMLTSLSEGFPYALPEGGKHHCATISTAVGAIPVIVLDGETGLLLEPGDTDMLTKLMLEMIDNPERRGQLGEALYRRTKAEFSLEATVQTQERIYRDILSRAHF